MQTALHDLYWIAYTRQAPGFPRSLLQIDELGNVKLQPRDVVPAGRIGFNYGAVALARDEKQRLVLWTFGGVNSPILCRVLLANDATMRLLSIHRLTNIKAAGPTWLSVSQKSLQYATLAYLQLRGTDIFLTGIKLAQQHPTGERVLLSPSICRTELCGSSGPGGVVSPDHRAALLISNRNLFVQLLSGASQPLGSPLLLNVTPNLDGTYYVGADISGPLSNGRRFVVFGRETFGPHDSYATVVVHLQVISGSGKRIGNKIVLLGPRRVYDIFSGSVIAIDPLGRFVVYSLADSAFGSNILLYQAIDRTGHPTGKPKVLVNDVMYSGIDMLK